MGRKRHPPNDPREWLNRARSNLAHARSIGPEIFLEDLCFDAQQAAEKAIKAVFIRRAEPFPYTHDLGKLLQNLTNNGLKIPKYVWEADDLSPFAVVTRYPGTVGPVSQRRYRRAHRIATAVLRWAERQIERP
jgi:HEPN domain-containing protein